MIWHDYNITNFIEYLKPWFNKCFQLICQDWLNKNIFCWTSQALEYAAVVSQATGCNDSTNALTCLQVRKNQWSLSVSLVHCTGSPGARCEKSGQPHRPLCRPDRLPLAGELSVCTSLLIWCWWLTKRANGHYKDHLGGQLTSFLFHFRISC